MSNQHRKTCSSCNIQAELRQVLAEVVTPLLSSLARTEDRLLREKEVRSYIPVGRSTFLAGVKEGLYPTPIKLGGTNFWRLSEIQEFIADQTAIRAGVAGDGA